MPDPNAPLIRAESDRDHAAIRAVVTAAFGSDVEADLVERIRSSAEYVPETALVAECEGEVVGHVMISDAVLRRDTGERRVAMLSPLAVAPDRQRSGVGAALVREVLALADARGEPIVVLEGSPAYYGRFGFQPAATLGIRLPVPDWAPVEAAQALCLSSYDSDDSSLRGDVVYPSSFDGVE